MYSPKRCEEFKTFSNNVSACGERTRISEMFLISDVYYDENLVFGMKM